MKYLSTGQCAKLLQISRTTLNRLISKGEITPTLLPGINHKRISEEELLRYVHTNGIKLPNEYPQQSTIDTIIQRIQNEIDTRQRDTNTNTRFYNENVVFGLKLALAFIKDEIHDSLQTKQ